MTLFVLVEETSLSTFDYIEKTILSVEMEYFEILVKNKLLSQFFPYICSRDSLKGVSPIFFDRADYGIILYDKGGEVSDIVSNYMSIHHSREFSEYGQILTW